jgi:catechol 2,3-dioxygenase-like lactoylglutathione lyase family enzyme
MAALLGIGGLDHVNVRTRDLERSQRFYATVLGLRVGDRPAFTFPGAWLYAGEQPIVHLVGDSRARQGENAAFDHIAFAATGMDAFAKKLKKAKIAFETRKVPGARRYQFFLVDPDGVKIELQFDAAAEARLDGSPRAAAAGRARVSKSAPRRRAKRSAGAKSR